MARPLPLLRRARPDARAPPRPRRAGPRRRVRAPEGPAGPAGRRPRRTPHRAALRRPQGRTAPPGHVVRRDPGAHRQLRRRRGGRGRGRRRCSTSPSATGTSTPPPRPTSCGSPRSSRRSSTPRTAPSRVDRRPRARPRQAAAARRGRPGARSRSASPTRRAGSSPPGRRSTARSRSSSACSTPRSATRSPRASCGNRPRPTRCGSSTSAAATPTSPSPRSASSPHVRACPCASPASTSSSSRPTTTAASPPSSASTPTSSSAPSATRRCRSRPTSCSPCTPATPPPTTRWPGRSSGRPAWCSPPRAATTTSRPSCVRRPRPRRTRMLTRHGILRERFADTLTDALRAAILRSLGYRVDVVEFVESAHTPRNTMLRATRTGQPAEAPREEYDDLVADVGSARRSSPSCWASAMAERLAPRARRRRRAHALRRSGSPPRGADRDGEEVFRFQDPEIVESSGLVVEGDRAHTINDSGDTGRVFTVDTATGETVGVTFWADGPMTSRRSRPAGAGHVWVADIGDNTADARLDRGHPGAGRRRRPHGRRGDHRPRLPRRPARRRGAARPPRRPVACTSPRRGSSAASSTPRRRSSADDAPNMLGLVGETAGIVTDGAFFPDGAHLILRTYTNAVVYTFPELERSARSTCRARSRARGSPSPSDEDVYLSSEGQQAPVLKVPLPPEISAALRRAHRRAVRPRRRAATAAEPEGGATAVDDLAAAAADRSVWWWVVSGLFSSASWPCCCGRSGRRWRPGPLGVRRGAHGARLACRHASPAPHVPRPAGLGPPTRGQGLHLPRRARQAAGRRGPRSAARTSSSRRRGRTSGSRRTPTATSRRSAPTTPGAGSTSTTRHWRTSRDAAKFDRIIDFGKAMSRARERVLTDLGAEGMSLERACAVAVRLLDLGYFRIGNDVYTDTNGSFGLTTLLQRARHQARRHAHLLLRRQVRDRALHRDRRRADDRGARRDAAASRRRRPSCSRGRTARAGATSTPARSTTTSARRPGSRPRPRTSAPGTPRCSPPLALAETEEPGETKASRKRAVSGAMKEVAEFLGNTPALARSAYVDPRVIEAYESGSDDHQRGPPLVQDRRRAAGRAGAGDAEVVAGELSSELRRRRSRSRR